MNCAIERCVKHMRKQSIISIRLLLTGVAVLWMFKAFTAPLLPVLPYPQQATESSATVKLSRHLQFTGVDRVIIDRLSANWKLLAEERSSADELQTWTLVLGDNPAKTGTLLQSYAPGWHTKTGSEGYLLVLNPQHRIMAANTETGLFYALQSLKQLTRAGWNHALVITDWPQFASRGVYDDISRGPIPTVAVVKKQIERLAELKFNALSFYIEHVVQPPSYPDFAPVNGKFTMNDIRELSDYAARFHMELVGSFQSFGHFNNILSLPQYAPMGETSTMISPLDPKARQFLTGVITDLCKVFSSPYFNVNCDETFDLGKGKSKAYVDSVGVARYYADHIRFLYDLLQKNGKQLMMWGDIALQHEEILDLLPKDVIYLTWEYGDQPSYDAWIAPFVRRGLKFIVCPGVVNSNRLFPDLQTAKANIRGFLQAGKKSGAMGALTTVWDDGGMCSFSNDWYGIYCAAERGWNTAGTGISTFDRRFEQTAYGTSNGHYGKALFKLMELRSIPLTYNLTDQVWTQKILPDSGKPLLENNQAVPRVLTVVRTALNEIQAARPLRNQLDIASLRFTLQQLELIMDSRLQLARLAGQYRNTGSSGNGTIGKDMMQTVTHLADRYWQLKRTYTSLWNAENQPYWLDINLKTFDSKIEGLQQLHHRLQAAAQAGVLPAPEAIGLQIKASDATYFPYWLLAGPFDTGSIPAFVYSEDPAFNVPPKPGDMALWQGKNYRWKKWSSLDGGFVDLAGYYGTDHGVAYAYCSINVDGPRTITALAGGRNMQLYLNGVRVGPQTAGSHEGETAFLLQLKKGLNHVVLKIPAGDGRWSYTFRLDTTEPITNHKHKYTLNAKNNVHETDN